MKRIISFVCVFVLVFAICGCNNGDSQITYNPAQPMSRITTTNSVNNISFELIENTINISGSFQTDLHKYLIVLLDNDDDSGKNKIKVENGSFSGTFELPDKKELKVELYGGKEEYGNFESIILNFIRIEKNDGIWSFVKSPVYEGNKEIFNKAKNHMDFLEPSQQIQSDDFEIIELANSITQGINDDYEKVRAIHDWVATNIYYDFDSFSSGNYSNMDAKNVLINRKGVCEGYANIMAALLRSQNIPCRVQSGYALGIDTDKEWTSSNVSTTESNHAWNEVYVNGNWIIIDATWDSQNQYKGGRYTMGSFITDIYFDSTMEFFSLSHKLIDLDEVI